MKKIIVLTGLLLHCAAGFSQSFSSPESVDYDVTGNRWIVGQNGSGEIHSLNPQTMQLTPIVSGIASGPHGIECVGNTVYCCDGSRIKGYDLNTGAPVFLANLGATFLNGLAWDGGDYLIATDFTAKKIYKINITDSTFTQFVPALAKTPNGIYYDGANSRCVFVTWGTNAPVQAVNMADSTVSTLTATTLSNCDGITRDPAGNWYVTAWGNNSLQKFDPLFSGTPVTVMSSLSSPADIDINAAGDSIGIPNSGAANNVVFYSVENADTGDTSTVGLQPDVAGGMQVFPNPAQNGMTITMTEAVLNGTIVLTDLQGKVKASGRMNGYAMHFDRGGLAAGIYIIEVRDALQQPVQRMRVIFTD